MTLPDANRTLGVVCGLRRGWEADDKGGSPRTAVGGGECQQRLYGGYRRGRGAGDVVDAGEECHWGSG